MEPAEAAPLLWLESGRTEPFRVGEPHGVVFRERWALPPFRYPAPGEPLTAEIATEEFKYSDLLMKAKNGPRRT
jgi:hypothetical protein